MTPKRVSQALFFYHVDFSADDRRQFVFHRGQVPQTPGRGRIKGNQHVYVAVGIEVVAQDGTEQRQFVDLPMPGEFGNLVGGNQLYQSLGDVDH